MVRRFAYVVFLSSYVKEEEEANDNVKIAKYTNQVTLGTL